MACVLFADDNADMRRYVEKLLNPRYEVVLCEDGQVALERARQTRPDLVLSDVMMPRMDGFVLLRELRKDKDLRDVPVILLTARAGEESRIGGLHAGADDYLVKPFSARELMARIGSHLTMAKIRREMAELKARNVEMSDEIKTLRGVLLVCSYCKKIEANPDTWIDLENYVRRHSDAEFNHGVCPECLRKITQEFGRS
jgi:DNA-binding response OmpR family regulator